MPMSMTKPMKNMGPLASERQALTQEKLMQMRFLPQELNASKKRGGARNLSATLRNSEWDLRVNSKQNKERTSVASGTQLLQQRKNLVKQQQSTLHDQDIIMKKLKTQLKVLRLDPKRSEKLDSNDNLP